MKNESLWKIFRKFEYNMKQVEYFYSDLNISE